MLTYQTVCSQGSAAALTAEHNAKVCHAAASPVYVVRCGAPTHLLSTVVINLCCLLQKSEELYVALSEEYERVTASERLSQQRGQELAQVINSAAATAAAGICVYHMPALRLIHHHLCIIWFPEHTSTRVKCGVSATWLTLFTEVRE